MHCDWLVPCKQMRQSHNVQITELSARAYDGDYYSMRYGMATKQNSKKMF